MLDEIGELNEQHLKKTAKILSLPADYIKKDFYITKALRVLINVENEYFKLVFQGGTSLSKGYKAIRCL